MKLFIDDERFPTRDDFFIARTSKEAIDFVKQNGIPDFISFDHDLGGDDTSRVFIHWLVNYLDTEDLNLPEGFSFTVHSQNPVGAKWIQGTMEGTIKHFGSK